MGRILDSHDVYIVEKDPVYRKFMRNTLIRKTNGHLGICEQLRMIYDSIEDLPDPALKERLTEQLVDALIFAKKISDRLSYYAKTYPDTTGHRGKNIITVVNNHWRIRKRWERKI